MSRPYVNRAGQRSRAGVTFARVSDAPLARAVFDGRPGHPVLIARHHWTPAAATLSGDRGARAYLDAHGVVDVECGDLYDGHDVDTPAADLGGRAHDLDRGPGGLA